MKKLKRRNVIELIIGHVKSDYGIDVITRETEGGLR